MKKSQLRKLTLKHETLKQLEVHAVKAARGGSPEPTLQLPCIERTAWVDCA